MQKLWLLKITFSDNNDFLIIVFLIKIKFTFKWYFRENQYIHHYFISRNCLMYIWMFDIILFHKISIIILLSGLQYHIWSMPSILNTIHQMKEILTQFLFDLIALHNSKELCNIMFLLINLVLRIFSRDGKIRQTNTTNDLFYRQWRNEQTYDHYAAKLYKYFLALLTNARFKDSASLKTYNLYSLRGAHQDQLEQYGRAIVDR